MKFWPFSKQPSALPAMQSAEPAAPCGRQDHFDWTRDHWPCPACTRQAIERNDASREDRLAEAIATRIVAKLQARALSA